MFPDATIRLSFPGRGLIWGVIVALMAGCAPAGRLETLPAPLAPEAGAAVVARVEAINGALRTFKGIGRLEIENAQQHRKARVAWAGSLPDRRLRLDLIGAGLPVASLASDGRRIYLRRHADGRLESRPASNPGLDGLIGLPVTVADVLSALAGRLPEFNRPFVSAHAEGETDDRLLVFHRRLGRPAGRAGIDADGRRLRWVERYGLDGGLHYRITYGDHRPVDGYMLPHRIEIRDSNGACRIQVERWWTDVPLDDSVFALTAADP